MKKYLRLISTVFFITTITSSFAQNSWLQKGNVGTAGRKNAAAFSIGTKGFIATGLGDFATMLKDCWAYNQTSGTWTQKADFGGTQRYGAVGFSVGNFGYVGTGIDASSVKSDFYKYDPSGNSWTAVASLPSPARRSACAFATSTKGYAGLGFSTVPLQDFFEYNPSNNSWTAIASFTGAARYLAVAASANDKGYVGTGLSGGASYYQDWYEYDPTLNSWASKTDFNGGLRAEAMAFGVDGKIYVGTGYNSTGTQKIDCNEFDPVANTWNQRADITLNTGRRNGAVGFAIGYYGYCATGTGPNGTMIDTWEYTPLNVGIEKNNLPDEMVHLYPNPSHGVMTLDYVLTKNTPAKFSLMDVMGKEVALYDLPSSAKSVKISEPSLNEGVYFYKVMLNDQSVASGRILIIR